MLVLALSIGLKSYVLFCRTIFTGYPSRARGQVDTILSQLVRSFRVGKIRYVVVLRQESGMKSSERFLGPNRRDNRIEWE